MATFCELSIINKNENPINNKIKSKLNQFRINFSSKYIEHIYFLLSFILSLLFNQRNLYKDKRLKSICCIFTKR